MKINIFYECALTNKTFSIKLNLNKIAFHKTFNLSWYGKDSWFLAYYYNITFIIVIGIMVWFKIHKTVMQCQVSDSGQSS